MRLARVYHKIQRRETAHLAKYNLTLAQFDVLAQLSANEGITQQRLADILLVTKGNVCGLVDRMSDQGWIERRADPEDRRSNLLYMTAKGKALADEVVPAHSVMLSEMMNALSQDDQRQLYAMLRHLERSLDGG
jgi:DNA-binding MarR family transcriptional regulator